MRHHIRTYLYAQSLRDTTTQFGVGPEEVAKLAHDDLLAERAVDPLHIAYDVVHRVGALLVVYHLPE